MKKSFIIFYVAIFCVVAGLSFAMPAFSTILLYEDFEDALDEDKFSVQSEDGPHGLSAEQVRAGSKSYKFSITCNTPWNGSYGDDRVELLMKAPIFDGSKNITIGKEYWIGFSLFLAEGYSTPTTSNGWLNHFNFHDQPDSPPVCEEFEGWTRHANFELTTCDVDGPNTPGWQMPILYDSRQCSSEREGGYWAKPGPYADSIGVWTDFVINVNWDYDDDGFMKIWKNGVVIIDYNGGTCYNDTVGPYIKFGIYSRVLDQDQTVTIYYDELRIGDSNSSYAEVAPVGSVKPLPPTNVEAEKITSDLTSR